MRKCCHWLLLGQTVKKRIAAVMLAVGMTMPYALADEQIVTKGDPFEGIEITVNINQASAQEIADLLVGIGIKKAEDIVSYRQEHGHFDSLESLDQVKGIGPSTLAKNKTRILFK